MRPARATKLVLAADRDVAEARECNLSRMSARSSNSLGLMPSGARMRTVDECLVRAPLETVFAVAADVERWPEHLPHYRYVRYRERRGGGGVVEMSANRPFGVVDWPTWWVSQMDMRPH